MHTVKLNIFQDQKFSWHDVVNENLFENSSWPRNCEWGIQLSSQFSETDSYFRIQDTRPFIWLGKITQMVLIFEMFLFIFFSIFQVISGYRYSAETADLTEIAKASPQWPQTFYPVLDEVTGVQIHLLF